MKKTYAVLGVAVFAIALALFFAITAYDSPDLGRTAIPISLAFYAIGMMGGIVFAILKDQDDRLRRLEELGSESKR